MGLAYDGAALARVVPMPDRAAYIGVERRPQTNDEMLAELTGWAASTQREAEAEAGS